MRATSIFVSAILLAGCGSDESGTFETEGGESGTYSINSEDDGSTISIKTANGELNIRSGEDSEVSLPKGFSLYSGAKVISNTDAQNNTGSMKSVMFSVKESLPKLADYYRMQAESAGYEIGTELKSDEMRLMSGKNSEGMSFTFNGSPHEDGATVVNLSFVAE